MSKKEPINIFFTINDAYAKYLATAMASILKNTQREICFYIIDGGISDDNKRKLSLLNHIRNFEIEYLPINKNLFNKMPKSSQSHISNETNYRFLISSIKPNMDKCLFLDADLVIDGDIGKLWDIDIHSYYMAAVTDQAPLEKGSWAASLPLPPQYTYVNTGVTIMNLKKWREDNIEQKLFDNVIKYSKLLRFPDQDILNITLAPKVKYLSHIFNAMPVQKYFNSEQEKEAFSNPIIIHWAGRCKPWINPTYKMGDIFWKYAAMTPFFADIIYFNFEQKMSNANDKFKDALHIGKLKWKYFKSKILSKILFGNKRSYYKCQKQNIKLRIKKVKHFFTGK